MIEHHDHKYQFLTVCAPEHRKTLSESLAPVQKVATDIASAMKALCFEEDKLERQKGRWLHQSSSLLPL